MTRNRAVVSYRGIAMQIHVSGFETRSAQHVTAVKIFKISKVLHLSRFPSQCCRIFQRRTEPYLYKVFTGRTQSWDSSVGKDTCDSVHGRG
jgi:hypothetical protein